MKENKYSTILFFSAFYKRRKRKGNEPNDVIVHVHVPQQDINQKIGYLPHSWTFKIRLKTVEDILNAEIFFSA